jgi:hypothetical protein
VPRAPARCAPRPVARRCQVSAPDLRIAVEPNINSGAVHYLRCAPSAVGGAERGLLSMALTLENVDTRQVHINKLGLSIAGSSTIIMPKTVDWVLDPHQPGASPYWVSAPSDQQFVIPTGPASMTLKLYAEGTSSRASASPSTLRKASSGWWA